MARGGELFVIIGGIFLVVLFVQLLGGKAKKEPETKAGIVAAAQLLGVSAFIMGVFAGIGLYRGFPLVEVVIAFGGGTLALFGYFTWYHFVWYGIGPINAEARNATFENSVVQRPITDTDSSWDRAS